MDIRILGRGIPNGQDCSDTQTLAKHVSQLLIPRCSYAEAPEIHAYFKGCAVKWNCMQFIKLNSRVIEACWSEKLSQWCLKIEDLSSSVVSHDFCHVLISATGVLK